MLILTNFACRINHQSQIIYSGQQTGQPILVCHENLIYTCRGKWKKKLKDTGKTRLTDLLFFLFYLADMQN